MDMAIRKAGIRPDEVDYINAHGTSTPLQRQARDAGHQARFGDHAYKLAVSSTKSMTGHLLGGAGGLEAGITALAVHHQIAPPTINLDNPDEECDLDYVPHTQPLDADRATRCRTRSASAAPTPRCCSSDSKRRPGLHCRLLTALALRQQLEQLAIEHLAITD